MMNTEEILECMSDAILHIKKLRYERDEARREVCRLLSNNKPILTNPPSSPEDFAIHRGWNCFSRETS